MNKWKVIPGREEETYIGVLPNGNGGLSPLYKKLGDMTQDELMRFKAYCPVTAPVIGPVLSLGNRDNSPTDPLPVAPKRKRKKAKPIEDPGEEISA